MESLPNFGLANATTGFATLFSGMTALLFCALVRRQPPHWERAWWLVVITGVFTVTLHGFGETNPMLLPRWFWSFLDTGSNIVVAWAFAACALADYWPERTRKIGSRAIAALMVIGVVWHFVDRMPSTPRTLLVPLGSWGGFYPGETLLIVLSVTSFLLFFRKRAEIPERARPLLLCVLVIFLVGMLLATASNEQIVWPFLSIHAIWHLVGAFGFVVLWAFEHVVLEERARRAEEPQSG
ncbi:MAG: hypothetical protein QNK05_02320 [Myxococcota bacterium]|nr:hypothetical protein [Myxococcota bacterium]